MPTHPLLRAALLSLTLARLAAADQHGNGNPPPPPGPPPACIVSVDAATTSVTVKDGPDATTTETYSVTAATTITKPGGVAGAFSDLAAGEPVDITATGTTATAIEILPPPPGPPGGNAPGNGPGNGAGEPPPPPGSGPLPGEGPPGGGASHHH